MHMHITCENNNSGGHNVIQAATKMASRTHTVKDTPGHKDKNQAVLC